MARNKLTAGRVRDFLCNADAGQSFLWDTEAPGLAVRATNKGAKAFIFQGKLRGQTIRITIGDVRTWDIESNNPERPGAREEARRLQSLIDQGIDPRQDRADRDTAAEARKDAARRLDVTVSEAWDSYIENRKAGWRPRHLQNLENLAKEGGKPRTRGRRPGDPETTKPGPIHPLLGMKLHALDSNAVRRWLEKEVQRGPGQADQAFRALRAFLGWCSEHEEYGAATQVDACLAKSVKEVAPTIGAKEGDVLQREQLRPWFEAVRRIKNPVISAYLQSLLLTGARREELAGLTWEGVDFQWKSLTIHDKVEGERIIPLTPYVSHLLRALKTRNETQPPMPKKLRQKGVVTKQEWKPSPWVFPSPTSASGRLQEPRLQHNNALEYAGLPHVSLHGLRRSFGTLAEWTETPVGVVAQIMGHKPSALAEKHYRRRPLDLLRAWHVKIEEWILEEAGIEQPKDEQAGLRLVSGGMA
jgi:integrase